MPHSKPDYLTSVSNLLEAEVDVIQNKNLVGERRDQLLDAAQELFIKKGFASTTIRDICGKSGINQASIYDYVLNDFTLDNYDPHPAIKATMSI